MRRPVILTLAIGLVVSAPALAGSHLFRPASPQPPSGVSPRATSRAPLPTTASRLSAIPEGHEAPAIRLHCFPNPFNPTVTVQFSLPVPAATDLAAYDVAGRPVDKLAVGRSGTGASYEAFWDGKDASGVEVAGACIRWC